LRGKFEIMRSLFITLLIAMPWLALAQVHIIPVPVSVEKRDGSLNISSLGRLVVSQIKDAEGEPDQRELETAMAWFEDQVGAH